MKIIVIMLIIGALSLTATACSKNNITSENNASDINQIESESKIDSSGNNEGNSKANSNNDTEDGTDYADFDDSDILDAIIYNGERYCGLGMKWELKKLPDDFELIGQFSGALTDDNEELSSTMIFHDNDNIYHYVDEEGKHYFCVACTKDDMYIGIYQATVSWSYEIDEPHEITY